MMQVRGSKVASLVLCGAIWAGTACAQTPEVKLFHPDGPLPAYDVATIKPPDPARPYGTTLRRFIQQAYGGVRMMIFRIDGPVNLITQVVGGPAWIDKDMYQITGKASEDDRTAMGKMTPDERSKRTEMMDQSLLAERFHLKVHFETREMPVYDLVPAQHGLKITPVEGPPSGGLNPANVKPGQMMPGMLRLAMRGDGSVIMDGRAITMDKLIGVLQSQESLGGRPIVNKTGFTGYFDVVGLRFSGAPSTSATPGEADAPTIPTVLEETFGLRLVPRKAPVEVLVIDSIDRPTEN